jgi:hypothetical protein
VRQLRAWLAAALLAGAGAAHAQPAPVTSPAPESVAVTIYRAPNRAAKAGMSLGWLQGYALVTETRKVRIPAGIATIRFEGVAARILPETAILTGLPEGVREKNLDAELLSGRTLYERNLNRPVTIRRRIGDRLVEEPAVIRSGASGAAIIQTREGVFAANCGPVRDTLVYDQVPVGLSAKPTLSVETDSTAEREVTLTLSYLAWGMDWQANYVATMRPDGKSADLFAWITLANGDITGFADAATSVVAGKIESPDQPERRGSGAGDVSFRCYPDWITPAARQAPDMRMRDVSDAPVAFMPPPPAPAPMMAREEIVVSGARMAKQEELGDLKLYRVPDRTTVAAMSQKQVALLDRKSVKLDVVYRNRTFNGAIGEPLRLVLRAQNKEAEGLGLALPAGPVAVFEAQGGERLLSGEGAIEDKAVGEEVEVELAAATQVSAVLTDGKKAKGKKRRGWTEHVLTVSNANPFAIRYEAELYVSPERTLERPSRKLGRKNGRDLWRVEVPANSSRALTYRLAEIREPKR